MTVRKTTLKQALAAAALAALAMSAATPASAQQPLDDGHASIFDAIQGRLKSGLGLGFGLAGENEQARIDYRERPPLVVPPNRELRPPMASVGERNSAWPRDYDAERVRRSGELARGTALNDPNHMSPHEIRTVGRLGANRPRDPAGEECENGVRSDGQVCNPTQFWSIMKNTRKVGDQRDVIAGQEPARRRLTDPPTGYRRAATTQKYTFEPPKEDTLADPRAQYREELARQRAVE